VTVFTGKAELGQGILTALAQIAADELDVGFDNIRMVSADTSRGPDEQYTFGSQSVEQSGSAIRAASAQARGILLAAAARRFGARPDDLRTKAGIIASPDGKRATFWEVASADPDLLKGDITGAAAPKKPSDYSIVGKSINRIDLPGKLTGAPSYVQDMRLPGMVFARVVRPPRYGAKLVSLDEAAVRSLPGVVAVVRDGNFLAVAAKREEQAIVARNALASAAHWSGDAVTLPDIADLHGELKRFRAETIIVGATGQSEPVPGQVKRVSGEYTRSYVSHASIGPSCAVAWLKDGRMTVWSHTQGVFPLRGDLAKVLGMNNGEVDVIHTPGAGCYGHNGADDVALDAALVARAVAGAPVKLQWMRDEEFAWAPFGPGMAMRVEAALTSDGRIVDWSYDLWSNSHAMRPGQRESSRCLGFEHPRTFLSRSATEIATRYHSTNCRGRRSETISCSMHRSETDLSERWELMETFSRSNLLWTSSPTSLGSTRCRSASCISEIPGPRLCFKLLLTKRAGLLERRVMADVDAG